MKPRSTVTALLAITESLIAARAKARAGEAGFLEPHRVPKIAKLLTEAGRWLLRIKTQAVS